MRELSPEGRSQVDDIARRNQVSPDAVTTLLDALDRGGGTMAQFSHPDLGGMGQWSRGGMIMIGDMFNNGLKARVERICSELSDKMHSQNLFAPQPQSSYGSSYCFQSSSGGGSWWPASCGAPNSTGSQNDMQYACFPDTRRLAISKGGRVSVYDTGDHRINGFSQQQSGGQSLSFASQYGTVNIHDLKLIEGDGV